MTSTPATERDAAWRSADAIDALVVQQLGLVRGIAHRMLRRMPPSTDVNDLIQTGTVGLLEAASRYRARVGCSFATYAAKRIRGAILDSSRRSDWCSRALRRQMRTIDDARLRIELQTAAAASARAIAAAAGITLEVYFRTLRDVDDAVYLRLDDPLTEIAHAGKGPEEEFERNELLQAMNAAVEALPKYERDIVRSYHDEDNLMREIGVKLGLSESRVCQIHKRTLERLRAAMT